MMLSYKVVEVRRTRHEPAGWQEKRNVPADMNQEPFGKESTIRKPRTLSEMLL